MWNDIACIIFACVTANHLGLVKAIETVTKCNQLPVIGCVKCLSFWSVLIYGLWSAGFADIPLVLAVSFLSAYIAIWLELLECYIDTLYLTLYEKIYPATESHDTPAADTRRDDTAGTVSYMQQEHQ